MRAARSSAVGAGNATMLSSGGCTGVICASICASVAQYQRSSDRTERMPLDCLARLTRSSENPARSAALAPGVTGSTVYA
ncbi:hypothetical protein, partial [Mycobacterium sp.]|uniref:hypothetical protein n=1 Tax=Mycobacterium sp. TaxID=1785 RepID=UPI003C76A7B0